MVFLGDSREEPVSDVALGTAIVNSVLAVLLVAGTGSKVPIISRWAWPHDFALVSDGLSVFGVLVASVLGALIIVYSRSYMAHEHDKARYYGLMLVVIGSMNGLALCENLLYLLVFWEACGVASFALIAFHHTDPAEIGRASWRERV